MATIINGKNIANGIKAALKREVECLAQNGTVPGLAVILVGDDPASRVYVKAKGRACREIGIASFEHRLPEETDRKELLNLIADLNRDDRVHGILVQLPLPANLEEREILEAIDPKKDVDGFHPYNMGRLVAGFPLFEPCTPLGIIKLLESAGICPSGKDAVIIGRSNIVGKPVALMLLQRNATVTICHSKTADLDKRVKEADILVVSVGRPGMIKGDWIKDGAVVIDVGINRMADGSLSGDVEFERACERASYITPVPGGVGPMTIAMLMHNTVQASKRIG